MSDLFVILPDQLFGEDLDNVLTCQKVLLIEDPLYFNPEFHPHKLILHRSSMRFFYDLLLSLAPKFAASKNVQKSQILYIEAADLKKAKAANFIEYLKNINTNVRVNMWWPSSEYEWPELKTVKFLGLPIYFYESPGFLYKRSDIDPIKHRGKHNQTAFYKKMKKIFTEGILNNGDRPLGGKWVYDDENRETAASFNTNIFSQNKLPKMPPKLQLKNPYFVEAAIYTQTKINKKYKEWINDIIQGSNSIRWPITHAEANNWLQDFVKKKLNNFGPFQDVTIINLENDNFSSNAIYHSCLSSSINIGLLTPRRILDVIFAAIKKKDIKEWLPSIEGFIRQIIGWREFIRFNYIINYKELTNGLDKGILSSPANNNLPEEWWDLKSSKYQINNDVRLQMPFPSSTGDDNIFNVIMRPLLKNLYYTAYLHHIPRLMIISNWMTLMQISPRETYNWFMKFFIDAYPWVMLPNIDMATFSCGLVGSRPYISSSNYLKKMILFNHQLSEERQGSNTKNWSKEWNKIYYKFIDKKAKILEKIYGFGPIISHWKGLSAAKKKELLS
jgi:deoxyribodipyrimidine photolyase-related protein